MRHQCFTGGVPGWMIFLQPNFLLVAYRASLFHGYVIVDQYWRIDN